jgi:isopropylmalate/homocitrate/citramalate synthase
LQILDSTLREGELFKTLPKDARVKVASKVADSGVRHVELTVDYPPRTTFEDNVEVIRALHDRGAKVVLHGRATEQDLTSMSRYDVEGCALYIAVSKMHREFKLHGITEDEAIGRLLDGVTQAHKLGFRYIRATLEDASRVFLKEGESGLELFRKSIERLKSAGATLASLPDTSGLMTPGTARSFFKKAKSVSCLPLSAHFHNDYGFASANTIEAALEGAEEVQVSVMGVGDRNGIADLYEVVATLEDIYGVSTGVERRSLRPLYSFFAKIAGIDLTWRHPLSEHAQTIRAGVHQSMTVRRKDGYIPAKKLVNDFGEPLYAISPYVSHNLVKTIIAPYSDISPESSKRVAEALARRFNGSTPSVRVVKEVIFNETGVEVPEHELKRYFAAERFYIMLRLSPQFPADALMAEISSLDDVDSVDEVYGDADMVIRAHTSYGERNLFTVLRQDFSKAIQEMRVLVTD